MYVIVSIAHLKDHDRTFIHGVFQDYAEARRVAKEIEGDTQYIINEGYTLSEEDFGVSVYISDIPMGVRVNDFVPTIH